MIEMREKLAEYLARPYWIEIVPDVATAGGIVSVALHPDLPGCLAHGPTAAEALANLQEARDLYIKTLVERGLEVPKPRARRRPFAA